MLTRRISLRLALSFITFALLASLAFAGRNRLSVFTTTPASAQDASSESFDKPSLTIGTCNTPGPIEIESTGGMTTSTPYATLGLAFSAVNAGTHTGIVNIEICADTAETASTVLNSSGAGSAIYTSVRISPLVDGVKIQGPSATGRGLIELNGADNVTIDGDNPNSAGTNRNLTIQNTAPSGTTFAQVIRIAIATTLVTSADNNTFKNLNIVGHASGKNASISTSVSGAENNSFGIYSSAGASTVNSIYAPAAVNSVSTPIGTGAVAANLTIQNNNITNTARAIAVQGGAETVFPGLLIENNTIGNPILGSADGVYSVGITVQGSTNAIVRGNLVYVESYVGAALHGINYGLISNNGSGMLFERNKVNRVQNNNDTAKGAYGLSLSGGSGHTVRNNFVSGVTSFANGFTTTSGAFGIRVGLGSGHFIYHNSVNMYGNLAGSGSALTAAFAITVSSSLGIDVRNNIFANTQSESGATSPSSSAFVAIYLPSGSSSGLNLTLNKNVYYIGSTPAVYNGYGQAGVISGANFYTTFDSTGTPSSSNLRSYTTLLNGNDTNDNASTAVAPVFVSPSDLHLQGTSPAINFGISVGVTGDIDGQMRPFGAAPDVGADEATPSAANVLLGGRILTANGRGIASAVVTLEGGNLNGVRRTLTGPFGYYAFDDLLVGHTYVLTVNSKRYTFKEPIRVVNLGDELMDVDFVAEN